MKTAIVIILLVILMGGALLYIIKAKKNGVKCVGCPHAAACNGCESQEAVLQKTFKIEGMHCPHCKARVEEIIGEIHGLTGTVDLEKGVALVTYAKPVEDALIKSKIEESGFTVVEIW